MRRFVLPLIAFALLYGAVALHGNHLSAASVALPQTLIGNGGAASWDVNNTGGTSNGLPAGGSCNDSPGLNIGDGSITGPDQDDAYDNGLLLWLNNAVFVAPSSVDVTGSTMTAGPVSMSGLNVTMQYFAAPSTPTLRTLVSFQNPSGSAMSATASWVTNSGADSGTVVDASSSGDLLFTTADRWIITDDTPDNSSDPTSSHILFGPGSPAVTPSSVSMTVFNCASTPGVLANFGVTVPAGSTRRLMFFNQMNHTQTSATTAISLFDTTPAFGSELVSGLSADQLAEVVNWSYAQPTPTATATVTLTVNPTIEPTERRNVGGAVGAIAAAAGPQARDNRAAADRAAADSAAAAQAIATAAIESARVNALNTNANTNTTTTTTRIGTGIAPPNTGDAGLASSSGTSAAKMIVIGAAGLILASVAGLEKRRRRF